MDEHSIHEKLLRHAKETGISSTSVGSFGLRTEFDLFKQRQGPGYFVVLFSVSTLFCFSFFIQIAELKRGAEIIVCTPGRMIDMLTANNGKNNTLRSCYSYTELMFCCVTFCEMLTINLTL